jgi:hypothetical protein
LSDVAFAWARARWTGHREIRRPLNLAEYLAALLYMLPKYTLRWLFFRAAGRRLDPTVRITEVCNPAKPDKVRAIAEKYGLNPLRFEAVCRALARHWVFLK